MTSRFIGGFAALGLLLAAPLGAAQAADMPLKAPPPVLAPVWTWTGFYIGASVGGDWARDVFEPIIPNEEVSPQDNLITPHNVTGAGTAGYNFQSELVVYGIEATWA